MPYIPGSTPSTPQKKATSPYLALIPNSSNHSVARHGGVYLWPQLPGWLNQEECGFKVEQGEPASTQMLNPAEGACQTPSHTFYRMWHLGFDTVLNYQPFFTVATCLSQWSWAEHCQHGTSSIVIARVPVLAASTDVTSVLVVKASFRHQERLIWGLERWISS